MIYSLLKSLLHEISFNHKTGAEDVHFTSVSSHSDSESDADCNKNDLLANNGDNEPSSEISYSDGTDLDSSLVLGDHTTVMEMIMVKDVEVGNEVRICSCSWSCFFNQFFP